MTVVGQSSCGKSRMAVVSQGWLRIAVVCLGQLWLAVVCPGQPWWAQGDWNEPMLAMMRLDDYNGYGELSFVKWDLDGCNEWPWWSHYGHCEHMEPWCIQGGCAEPRLAVMSTGGRDEARVAVVIHHLYGSSVMVHNHQKLSVMIIIQQHISPGECGDPKIHNPQYLHLLVKEKL